MVGSSMRARWALMVERDWQEMVKLLGDSRVGATGSREQEVELATRPRERVRTVELATRPRERVRTGGRVRVWGWVG